MTRIDADNQVVESSAHERKSGRLNKESRKAGICNLGRIREESTSPALPYGRVENARRSIYESVLIGYQAGSRSRISFSERLIRAARETNSTPYSPSRSTGSEFFSHPLLSMPSQSPFVASLSLSEQSAVFSNPRGSLSHPWHCGVPARRGE